MSSHESSVGGLTPKDIPNQLKEPKPTEPPKVDPISEDNSKDNKIENIESMDDNESKDNKGSKTEEDYIKTLFMTSFPEQHK